MLDFQAQAISIFDSDGAFTHIIGGKGTGPGEFEQALSVDISQNGISVRESGDFTEFLDAYAW